MFTVRLAELNIGVDNKYPYIEDMCKDYITTELPDFTVSATCEEIQAEGESGDFPAEYLESLAIYRKIADRIIDYDGLLVHGVVMSAFNTGVALCARSGTGKTTHSLLWKSLLGDDCEIINGDKPLVRIIDGEVYAYGTPWAGKEGVHKNARVKLEKICFIERSGDNQVMPCDNKDILGRMMEQVYLPKQGILVAKTMDILDRVIRSTQAYIVKCNMDIAAAKTAFDGIEIAKR